MPLGVTTTKDYWNFSVAVPKGGTCRLLLYRAGEMRPCISYDMEAVLGEIHAITSVSYTHLGSVPDPILGAEKI